jgi:RimJ/RimL family protein N-acetyltransferase
VTAPAAWAFRRLVPGDAAELFHTCGDPDVMRYWSPGPDPDVATTAARIDGLEAHWRTHGFGDQGVVLVPDGHLLGFAGLHHLDGMDEVNVGYAFRRSVWGRGLGREVCRELLRRGFDELGLPVVVAVVDPRNAASVALAASCGLTLSRRFVWSGQQRLLLRITAGEWAASGPRGGLPESPPR